MVEAVAMRPLLLILATTAVLGGVAATGHNPALSSLLKLAPLPLPLVLPPVTRGVAGPLWRYPSPEFPRLSAVPVCALCVLTIVLPCLWSVLLRLPSSEGSGSRFEARFEDMA